jgi:plastocyanin
MSRFRPSTRLAALAGLAVVVVACTGTTASPPASTPTPSAAQTTSPPPDSDSADPSASEPTAEQLTVSMDGSEFIPAELAIAAGTEVIFVNVSEFEHTVTEGSGGRAVEDPFVDVEVAEGDSEGVTFDEPGTYDITCRIHPTMQLIITVED